jgi:hypothetical protein
VQAERARDTQRIHFRIHRRNPPTLMTPKESPKELQISSQPYLLIALDGHDGVMGCDL